MVAILFGDAAFSLELGGRFLSFENRGDLLSIAVEAW